jgi:hypothetical protein
LAITTLGRNDSNEHDIDLVQQRLDAIIVADLVFICGRYRWRGGVPLPPASGRTRRSVEAGRMICYWPGQNQAYYEAGILKGEKPSSATSSGSWRTTIGTPSVRRRAFFVSRVMMASGSIVDAVTHVRDSGCAAPS